MDEKNTSLKRKYDENEVTTEKYKVPSSKTLYIKTLTTIK